MYRVRGGTQALPLGVAKQLQGNLTFSAPVTHIAATDEGVTITTRTGKVFKAAHVIVTGPPAALLGIEFAPSLPGAQVKLVANYKLRVVLTSTSLTPHADLG